jgi:hypothetical protein
MNFLLIALCLLAGPVLRSSGLVPEGSHRGINAWILYVAMPAVALLYLPETRWSTELILPAAMPFLVWAGAWLMLKLCAGRLGLDPETQAALLLTAGLGNTSFIGFPLTEAYFGTEGLRIAVFCDQACFIALSSLGVLTALKASHGAAFGAKTMVTNIVRFPPFLAFAAGLLLPRFLDYSPLDPLLAKLAGTLVPLALFSVGLQIQISDWRSELRPLSLGLAYKLLLAPALVLGVSLACHAKGIIAQASIFEAAMAPMVTAAILAAQYRLNPRLSNLMVGVGILLSIVTTGLWSLILHTLR